MQAMQRTARIDAMKQRQEPMQASKVSNQCQEATPVIKVGNQWQKLTAEIDDRNLRQEAISGSNIRKQRDKSKCAQCKEAGIKAGKQRQESTPGSNIRKQYQEATGPIKMQAMQRRNSKN
jgi:hypothetical protein